MHDLVVKNLCNKEEWWQFVKYLADLEMKPTEFFREIVKGAINDNQN